MVLVLGVAVIAGAHADALIRSQAVSFAVAVILITVVATTPSIDHSV